METLAKVLTSPEAAPAGGAALAAEEKSHRTPQNEVDPEKTQEDSASTRPSTHQSTVPPAAADAPGADPEGDYLTGLKLVAIMSCITMVAFLMLLDTSIVATAIPYITNEFHSLADVGWYGSAYQLASAALQPLTGKIYTHFNVRWTFLLFFALFELGSLVCGVANSSNVLIVGRAIAGMGGAGLMNGAMTIITAAVPLHRQPPLMGMLMAFAQLGVVCGPLIGGALTEYSTWRWCFYLNLPIGAAVFAYMVWVRIPDNSPKRPPLVVLKTIHRELDLVGFTLLAPSTIQLLLALQWGGNKYAWNSATIIGLLCGAGGTFIVWLVWNWRQGDAALIPLDMMKRRAVWSSATTGMSLFVNVMLVAYYLPIYFQSIKDVSPSKSGINVLPGILGQLVAAVSSGALSSRTGYVIPYVLFSGTIMSVGAGLMSRFSPFTPTAEWAGIQFLSGVGRGAGMQMPMIAIQTVLKPGEASVAMSMLMFAQYMSTAIMLSIANTVFTQSLGSELAEHAPNANAEQILLAGATAFRKFISVEDLPGVLLAYANSIDRVFYLCVGAAVVSLASAPFLGWVDIRKKKTPEAGAEQA
ncbi:MFS general substrate transporter [Thozetella sp. PMI_491]|nr:MFS general substrate transporter [Thozetella sp. PMI_491]